VEVWRRTMKSEPLFQSSSNVFYMLLLRGSLLLPLLDTRYP
jgi:hypothetical protein